MADASVLKTRGEIRAGSSPAVGTCPLLYIEWLDSARPEPGWEHLADFAPREPIHCVSVGWAVHRDRTTTALAPNMGDLRSEANLQACGIIHIPTRSITRVVKLKEPSSL